MCQPAFLPRFASFNGAYEGHEQIMHKANLTPEDNLWFAVFDFNDEITKGGNWSILKSSEETSIWCPLGPAQNCCPRIEAGSISAPSQETEAWKGMMSFSMTTQKDAVTPDQSIKASDDIAGVDLSDAPADDAYDKVDGKRSFYFRNILSKFALDKWIFLAFALPSLAADFWRWITTWDIHNTSPTESTK